MEKRSLVIFVVALAILGALFYFGRTSDPASSQDQIVLPQEGVYRDETQGFEIDPTPLVLTRDTSQVGFVPLCQTPGMVACFIYPKEQFSSPRFEHAALWVDISSLNTLESPCARSSATDSLVIGGENFIVRDESNAATGHVQELRSYFVVHASQCYTLYTGVDYVTADIGEGETTVAQLTEDDKKEIRDIMDRSIRTFRFIK